MRYDSVMDRGLPRHPGPLPALRAPRRGRANRGRCSASVCLSVILSFHARSVISCLREGFRELGYVEGQNIAFEYRSRRRSTSDCPSSRRTLCEQVDVVLTVWARRPPRGQEGDRRPSPSCSWSCRWVRRGPRHELRATRRECHGIHLPLRGDGGETAPAPQRGGAPASSRVATLSNPANPATLRCERYREGRPPDQSPGSATRHSGSGRHGAHLPVRQKEKVEGLVVLRISC